MEPTRRHSKLKTGIAATLALLAFATAAPSAGAAEPGVVSDLTWYISDGEKTRESQVLQDLGSKWVRLSISWRDTQPEANRYNDWWLAEYQEAIDVAHAAGQKVIVMVNDAPAWASGSSGSLIPQQAGDYANFMSFVASRYGAKVDAWEIWNEQNISRFWTGGPNPTAYAALLRAAYPAVKSADPTATVLFGGLSGNDYDFLAAAYAAGAKGFFDALATHPYTYCGTTGPADIRMSGSRISKDSFLGYRELRSTMLAQGDDKPIWITEMGWNTSTATCSPGAGMWQGGVSEGSQADFLYETLKLLEADPYVQVALWYNVRNNYWSGDANEPEAQYGLTRTDFSPKPAYGAFRAYSHGLPYTPSTPPPATRKKKKTRTTLQVQSASAPAATAVGRVAGAQDGDVVILTQVRKGGRWRSIQKQTVRVRRSGRFSTKLRRPRGKKVRVRAVFHGTDEQKSSRSRFVRLGGSQASPAARRS
ncbi:MAG TPA: family 1 glycosylhydrolase [Solirubrobacterales bacterium]|nr:family 1 glycosylhydrolase [Solirubrobacterales bacterium]